MQNIDYKLLSERVSSRIATRTHITSRVFFFVNLLLYILFTVISVSVIGNRPGIGFGGAVTPIDSALMFAWVGWGLCILFYGMTLLMNDPDQVKKMRQHLAEQELGKMAIEAMDGETLEKPKHYGSSEIELGDDGELVPREEAIEQPQARHSAKQR